MFCNAKDANYNYNYNYNFNYNYNNSYSLRGNLWITLHSVQKPVDNLPFPPAQMHNFPFLGEHSLRWRNYFEFFAEFS